MTFPEIDFPRKCIVTPDVTRAPLQCASKAHRLACLFDSCSALRSLKHSAYCWCSLTSPTCALIHDRITPLVFTIITCGVLCSSCLSSSCSVECRLTYCYPDLAPRVLLVPEFLRTFHLLETICSLRFHLPLPPLPLHSQLNTNTKTKTKYNVTLTSHRGSPPLTNK